MAYFGDDSAKIQNGKRQRVKPIPTPNSKESLKDNINFTT